jgi:hypothetical protein
MTTMPDPYERITFRGKTVNRRTAAMLSVMEQRLGYELTLVQGSYNAGGVAASAGTHDGGGAVDLAPFDWRNKCHVGREVGFDIWHRLPSQGPWSEHNHGIAAGDREASSGAKVQETEYNEGLDGLADTPTIRSRSTRPGRPCSTTPRGGETSRPPVETTSSGPRSRAGVPSARRSRSASAPSAPGAPCSRPRSSTLRPR